MQSLMESLTNWLMKHDDFIIFINISMFITLFIAVGRSWIIITDDLIWSSFVLIVIVSMLSVLYSLSLSRV